MIVDLAQVIPRQFTKAYHVLCDQQVQRSTKLNAPLGNVVQRCLAGQSGTSIFANAGLLSSKLVSLLLRILYAFSGVSIGFYRIFRWPLNILATALLLLNLFATIYYLSSGVFIDSFCHRRLPIVRDFLCSSWDEFQTIQSSNTTNYFRQPYSAYLHADDVYLSQGLRSDLGLWQIQFSWFRAYLSRSKMDSKDKQLFNDQFSTFIDQGARAGRYSLKMNHQIMGNIIEYVSRTTYQLKPDMIRGGLLNNETLYVNGPLAQDMAFYNSYYMLYLPGGLQPFQTNLRLRAVQLVQDSVDSISLNLRGDIAVIKALRTSLNDLSATLYEIQTHASHTGSVNEGSGITFLWTALRRKFSGIENRDIATEPLWWTALIRNLNFELGDEEKRQLEVMLPTLQATSEKLGNLADDFEQAQFACQRLYYRLLLERRAAKYGKETSWLQEQIRELLDDSADLEVDLHNFRSK